MSANQKVVKLLNHQFEILADTTTKIMGLVGGYGNGKTYTACRKAIQLSQLNAGFTGIVTEPTFPMLRDIFVPEMKQALEEWGIKYKFNASSYIFELFINGQTSKIICMSAENYERLVGINAAWVIMDEFDTSKEEIAMKAFNKLLGRLRSGNVRQFIIFTTPEGFRATYRIFVKENDGSRRIIKGKTKDNKYLPPDFIEELEKQYTPELLKAYLEGEFVNLASGNIYKYFDRNKHHTNAEIEEHEILYVGADFNVGGCCGAVCVIRNGIPYVLDEYSVYDTQEIINHLNNKYPNREIWIIPDASGDNAKTNASKTDIQLLRDAGFNVDAPSSNPLVVNRVNTLNNLFYRNEIFINTHKCPNTTQALEQHAYDEKGNPEKFNNHPSIDDRTDCLGYFIHRKFGVDRPRVSENEFRLF